MTKSKNHAWLAWASLAALLGGAAWIYLGTLGIPPRRWVERHYGQRWIVERFWGGPEVNKKYGSSVVTRYTLDIPQERGLCPRQDLLVIAANRVKLVVNRIGYGEECSMKRVSAIGPP